MIKLICFDANLLSRFLESDRNNENAKNALRPLGHYSVELQLGDLFLRRMESKLKSIEIVKFKSITNRVQLADVSIINNVVFAPFDCECNYELGLSWLVCLSVN